MNNNIKLSIGISLSVLLLGCSSSSEVMKIGPDTYTVSASVDNMLGGMSAAKEMSLGKANQFCGSLEKEILVTSIDIEEDSSDFGHSDIIFRCLRPNDKELKRPTFRNKPNVIIENRSE